MVGRAAVTGAYRHRMDRDTGVFFFLLLVIGGLLCGLAGVILFITGMVRLIWKKEPGWLLLSLPIGGFGYFLLKLTAEIGAAC